MCTVSKSSQGESFIKYTKTGSFSMVQIKVDLVYGIATCLWIEKKD